MFHGIRLICCPGLPANTKVHVFLKHKSVFLRRGSAVSRVSQTPPAALHVQTKERVKIISRFLTVHLGIETFLYAH